MDGKRTKNHVKLPPKRENYHTFYLKMKDGVRLAVDLYLPENAQNVPCILHQTRYMRSVVLRWPFNYFIRGGKPLNVMASPFFSSFVQSGFAVVSIDVRGTGASFGTVSGLWTETEQKDSEAVLDWIVKQPWSNGSVGLWGISYEGTSAFYTMARRHPAVKACVPMYMLWDIYDDISCPGGIPQHMFPKLWQDFNSAIDRDQLSDRHLFANLVVLGVTPASDADELKMAVREHETNWKITDDSKHMKYRDSLAPTAGIPIDQACSYRVREQANEARVPTLFYSGWFDCTARGALQGFCALDYSSVIIGPWNHAGVQNVRPESYTSFSVYDHVGEVTQFFNRHLQQTSRVHSRVLSDAVDAMALGSVHFYCLGEDS